MDRGLPRRRLRAEPRLRVGHAKAAQGTRGSLACCPGDGSLRGSACGCRSEGILECRWRRRGAGDRPTPAVAAGPGVTSPAARVVEAERGRARFPMNPAPDLRQSEHERSPPSRLLRATTDPGRRRNARHRPPPDVGGAVAPAMLQPVEEPAVVEPRQSLRRAGRAAAAHLRAGRPRPDPHRARDRIARAAGRSAALPGLPLGQPRRRREAGAGGSARSG